MLSECAWRRIVRHGGGIRDFGPIFVCIHDGGVIAGTISTVRLKCGDKWMFRRERFSWKRKKSAVEVALRRANLPPNDALKVLYARGRRLRGFNAD